VQPLSINIDVVLLSRPYHVTRSKKKRRGRTDFAPGPADRRATRSHRATRWQIASIAVPEIERIGAHGSRGRHNPPCSARAQVPNAVSKAAGRRTQDLGASPRGGPAAELSRTATARAPVCFHFAAASDARARPPARAHRLLLIPA